MITTDEQKEQGDMWATSHEILDNTLLKTDLFDNYFLGINTVVKLYFNDINST